jgi:hypothetical protein
VSPRAIAAVALAVLAPVLLSGCLLAGGAVGFGVLHSMADKGTKYRYDAPLETVRAGLDAFCREERIDVATVEDLEGSALRLGRTADDRRVRIEAVPWDDAATIVFIRVGVSGDTFAADELHERFARRMNRPGR